ncbi:MAG: DUF177 domain-containing protein [Thermoanaerobacterales bacterium]|nr:DUF177 domain-containing protein [Thermoanaerobacterales bacterium]
MFQVDLSALREHPGQPLHLTMTGILESLRHPDEGEEEPLVPDPVRVDLQVTYLGGVYWLEGTVDGEAVLRCGRCLGKFRHPFRAALVEKYRQGTAKDADEETLPDGERLVLDERLREAVLLALPMRPLCREDCRGLCPKCGKLLNEGPCACPGEDIDPRLAKLAAVLKNAEKGV